jgi:hypothetical protein
MEQTQEGDMRSRFEKPVPPAGPRLAAAVLAAAFLLMPLSLNTADPLGYAGALAAGDNGGGKDMVHGRVSDGDSSPGSQPTTPCLSCYSGASLMGTQNKEPYVVQATAPCQTCVNGSMGK